MIRVTVDMERCQHYGQCVLEAPSVFQLNEQNKLEWTATAAVEDREAVEAAADICPMQAILVG
jgi:ferredoxin